MSLTTTAPTLASVLWPDDKHNRILRAAILMIAGSLLLWVSAKFKVPGPVPMSMQSLVVLGLGATLGWRLGAGAVLVYLAEGAAHLPVFAQTPEKGIGWAYMIGPTGGYLAGFVLAAAATGWLAERGADRNVFTMFAAMLAGAVIIYIPGLAWLGHLIGMEKAIQFGLMPFWLGDLIKAAVAALAFPAAWAFFAGRKQA